MSVYDRAAFLPGDKAGAAMVNALPIEVLSYVFTLATHGDGSSSNAVPFDHSSITTPSKLASVCRRWYHVARTTPALYTSISVSPLDFDVLDYSTCTCPIKHEPRLLLAEHISTYLALSRNAPLDIVIDARDPEWDFTEPGLVFIHLMNIMHPDITLESKWILIFPAHMKLPSPPLR